MAILKRFQDVLEYLWEGVSRIFGPSKDQYPETGVQPFEGDPFDEHEHSQKLNS